MQRVGSTVDKFARCVRQRGITAVTRHDRVRAPPASASPSLRRGEVTADHEAGFGVADASMGNRPDLHNEPTPSGPEPGRPTQDYHVCVCGPD